MTSFDNLSFITNNVKGIQSMKKRLKLIEYFKSKITTHGTLFLKLNRGACQGDPISAYLFILAFEILIIIIKENPHIKGLNIFDNCYLYSAYADDTTFFLKGVNSIKEMVNNFHIFSSFSGLRPNLSKCEIAGIGLLTEVKVTVCGIEYVDLVLDTIKILGTHFSYNEKLKEERIFV